MRTSARLFLCLRLFLVADLSLALYAWPQFGAWKTMAVPLKTLEELLKKLPATSQAEVIHFAEFLSR